MVQLVGKFWQARQGEVHPVHTWVVGSGYVPDEHAVDATHALIEASKND